MGNKIYRQPGPARPENEHPKYQQWLKENGYLKDRLQEACRLISELDHENKDLKNNVLPIGKWNNKRA